MYKHEYPAKILRVVDGDTVECRLDMGCKVYFGSNVRFAHLNAMEKNSEDEKERERAKNAEEYVIFWIANNLPKDGSCFMVSDGLDDYGRPLVMIYIKWKPKDLGESLNETMLKLGIVDPYPKLKTK